MFFLLGNSYAALMQLLFEMGVIWDLHRSFIGLATNVQQVKKGKGKSPYAGRFRGAKNPTPPRNSRGIDGGVVFKFVIANKKATDLY